MNPASVVFLFSPGWAARCSIPRSALVVKLIRPEKRGRFFSILMMQDSAGAVIGALLGSWLLQYDFRLVCATGAIIFILCAAFNARLLPAWKLSTVKIPVREGMNHVMRDKRFVTYVLTLAGYYMLAVRDADAADYG